MQSPNQHRNSIMPMLIIGALFFVFGFVTWLNGTLIAYLKVACQLNNLEATLVTFAFYISYTIMALPSAWVLKHTGLHRGMTIGLLVMAVGALLFIPAAYQRIYWIFLTGLFVEGAGLALLQTAANPYVAIIGPSESAARRISIMGICNKLAGVVAPLILAHFVLQDVDLLEQSLDQMDAAAQASALDALSRRAIAPYACIAIALCVLGIAVRLSPLPNVNQEDEAETDTNAQPDHRTSVLQFPNLILGAIALFFYVGVEVIAGDTIIQYGKMQGLPISTAQTLTSYTLAAMILGYIMGIIAIPRFISQQRALLLSAALGLTLSAGVVLLPAKASITCLALLGLANAIMWPAIWPLAIHGLGRFLNAGSALLIMAIAGGAIVPLLWGWLADKGSPQTAYIIMLPLYFAIFAYASKGYRIKTWHKK